MAPNPAVVHGGTPRSDHFFAPRTLDELAALRAERPQARLLAGCTDIGLWVNKQFRDLGDILYLGEVDELKRITVADGALHIGAGATLEDAWSALAAHWPSLQRSLAAFCRPAGAPRRHDGRQRRQRLADRRQRAGADGAGRAHPLRHGDATREMALEDFYLDYMKNQLQPGELVTGVSVPLPTPAQQLRAYKISKRYDCDISALFAGLALELDGDVVTSARFAFGGMAAVVKRARGAEAAVVGQPWTEATVQAAMQALGTDFTPLSDLRASADYRRQVAQGLLKRLWLETRTQQPLAQASVWAGCRGRHGLRETCHEQDHRRALRHRCAGAVGGAPCARIGAPARGRHRDLHRRPARTGRHAARRAGPVAAGARPAARASTSTRCAPCPAWWTCSRPSDIPGANDCGPIVHDDPILAEGTVQYLGQPVFAVIATHARRGAPRGGACEGLPGHRAAAGGADGARGACGSSPTWCRRCT